MGPSTLLWMSCHGSRGPCSGGTLLASELRKSPLCSFNSVEYNSWSISNMNLFNRTFLLALTRNLLRSSGGIWFKKRLILLCAIQSSGGHCNTCKDFRTFLSDEIASYQVCHIFLQSNPVLQRKQRASSDPRTDRPRRRWRSSGDACTRRWQTRSVKALN